MKKIEFKIGDKVTNCNGDGKTFKGIVVEIFGDEDIYPIRVEFENGNGGDFTKDGRWHYSEERRSLHHGHNVTAAFNIEGEEIPKRKVKCDHLNTKPGELVEWLGQKYKVHGIFSENGQCNFVVSLPLVSNYMIINSINFYKEE